MDNTKTFVGSGIDTTEIILYPGDRTETIVGIEIYNGVDSIDIMLDVKTLENLIESLQSILDTSDEIAESEGEEAAKMKAKKRQDTIERSYEFYCDQMEDRNRGI